MVRVSGPLVSVIVPCYNVENSIEFAINSIIAQSYVNLEILIVDDASTDGTRASIMKIDDERIRTFILNENTKKIGAVNLALDKSKGEYITFQDGDDWSDATRIEKQVLAFMNDPKLGVCFTRDNRVHFNSSVETKNVALNYDDLKTVFVDFLRNNATCKMPACATGMISRDVFRRIGGYQPYFAGHVGEDIYWFYQILREFKGICLDEALYNYKFNIDGFTGNQIRGVNARYLYSWELLSRIISIENDSGADFFDNTNDFDLVKLELAACETVLMENVRTLYTFQENCRNSLEFRIGVSLLYPLRLLKRTTRVLLLRLSKIFARTENF
jgi:glycosyltransferase involved in cell wall biosynthesis